MPFEKKMNDFPESFESFNLVVLCILNGIYFSVTDIHNLYQFYVLLMMGAQGTRNMYSDFAVQ